MSYIILICVVISLFCNGLFAAASPGMLLHGLSIKWDRFLSGNGPQHWLYTITIGCIYCMASFWGSAIYWALQITGPITLGDLVLWPIVCVICVYINGLFFHLHSAVKRDN